MGAAVAGRAAGLGAEGLEPAGGVIGLRAILEPADEGLLIATLDLLLSYAIKDFGATIEALPAAVAVAGLRSFASTGFGAALGRTLVNSL